MCKSGGKDMNTNDFENLFKTCSNLNSSGQLKKISETLPDSYKTSFQKLTESIVAIAELKDKESLSKQIENALK